MRVLLVGVGVVGQAIAVLAHERAWLEKMVLADYNLKRAKEVRRRLAPARTFPIEQLDARDNRQIVALAKKHDVDLILNAVDPLFNEPIFDAAYQAGCHYIDLAMTLSKPHPSGPTSSAG
jgi:saccharopine dehydrogenase (NAD+, L-lysine forming)